MFRRFAVFVYMFKWPILLGLILVTLVMGMSVLKLQIDPSMETLFAKNTPEYRYYREYSERYGSDQMIAVAMATDDVFTMDNLKLLRDLTEEVSAFDNVERVMSLTN